MDKVIHNILKRIEDEGYEAYIVGGFVRDKLLGKDTYDVDICTNARPINLKDIFPINQNSNGYGGFNLKIKRYNIDITTYRKEKAYVGHNPSEVEYVNSLFEDIKRRDFTINSFCMDKNGNVLDLLNAMDDLKNKVIRVVGDPDHKFSEDPLRMLRAIRFATLLDFDIDDNALNSIKKNYGLTAKLSNERIKEEVIKILSNVNYQKGLNLLKETRINEVIGLKNDFDKIEYSSDILGMLAQIDIKRINLTHTELETIKVLRKLIQKGKVDNFDLFNYGLYPCSVVSEILGLKKSEINKMYEKMPIKSMKDIDIDGKDIMNILGIQPGKEIGIIMINVRNAILNGIIKNNKSDIKEFILHGGYHE